MKSKLIRIEFVARDSYMAIDEANRVRAKGSSPADAAICLIIGNPGIYKVIFVDLSRSGLVTAFYGGNDSKDVEIFSARQSKAQIFCASVRIPGAKHESLAPKAEDAAFNLIAGHHPIFGIDFDLSLAQPSWRNVPQPDDFVVLG